MLEKYNLEKVIFLDIETTSSFDKFEDLENDLELVFNFNIEYYKNEENRESQLYLEAKNRLANCVQRNIRKAH